LYTTTTTITTITIVITCNQKAMPSYIYPPGLTPMASVTKAVAGTADLKPSSSLLFHDERASSATIGSLLSARPRPNRQNVRTDINKASIDLTPMLKLAQEGKGPQDLPVHQYLYVTF
jgi:hypothetical protein